MRYLNPQRIAVLIGIVAGVAAKRVDPGLSGWDQFGIVVAGSVAAAGILWAIQQIWRRVRWPTILIECGDSAEFQQVVLREERHMRAESPAVPFSVHMTRLMVSEAKGRSTLPVKIQLASMNGKGIKSGRPGLQWITGADDLEIPRSGRIWLRLCERVFDVNGVRVISSVHWQDVRLEPGCHFEFELEALIENRSAGKQGFVVDWTTEDALYPDVSAK